jgi:DNA-binding response OmpR family regulator
MPDYTPTQQRMLAILADGMPHTREELHTCINDDLADMHVVNVHISLLRRKLRPIGQDIVKEIGFQFKHYFRHIRLLASSTDGKR